MGWLWLDTLLLSILIEYTCDMRAQAAAIALNGEHVWQYSFLTNWSWVLKTFDKSGKKRSSSTKKGRDPHVKKISSLATAHTIFKIIIKTFAKKIHTLQTAFPFFKLSFSFCENLFPGGSHAFRKKRQNSSLWTLVWNQPRAPHKFTLGESAIF